MTGPEPKPQTPLAKDEAEFGARLMRSGVVAVAAVRDGKVVYSNRAFATLFGVPDLPAGTELSELISVQDHSVLEESVARAQTIATKFVGLARRPTGSLFELELDLAHEQGDLPGNLILIGEDATERRRMEAQLSSLAFLDPLTGLANRALFTDRSQQVWSNARRLGGTFGVLMVDLDAFKAVNDQHGHAAGDLVLQTAAQRFLACLRETDTLARYGGDEFAVLLPGVGQPEDAAVVAGRIVRSLEKPIVCDGTPCRVGASIGIALYPEHGATVDALLAAADGAMYLAKAAGKGRYEWPSRGQLVAHCPVQFIAFGEGQLVGVREIDEQHRHLVDLANQVGEALKSGASSTAMVAALNELIRFAELHFSTEERLMAEHGITDARSHRENHRKLLDDIHSLSLHSDGVSLSLTMRYLQVWLLRHVESQDRALARALNARGIT